MQIPHGTFRFILEFDREGGLDALLRRLRESFTGAWLMSESSGRVEVAFDRPHDGGLVAAVHHLDSLIGQTEARVAGFTLLSVTIAQVSERNGDHSHPIANWKRVDHIDAVTVSERLLQGLAKAYVQRRQSLASAPA